MSKDSQDRLPPRSQEAERSVLGSLLRDNAVFPDVSLIVQAGSFYEDAHQKIYAAIVALFDAGKPVDLVTVAEELIQRRQVEDIGGLPYLYELQESSPTAANAVYYAEIVRDRAMTRGLIHVATEVLRDAYDQALPPLDMLGIAEEKILHIANFRQTEDAVPVSVAVDEACARIDFRQAHGGGGITGIATGFADLDNLTAGMQDSELVMIGARPSSGKTALAGQIALHAALTLRVPTLFISMEQRRHDLAERLLSATGRVDFKRMRKGLLTPDDLERLHEAVGVLRDAPLKIDQRPNLTLSQVKAVTRQQHRKFGVRLLILDYLQEMRAEGGDNREQQVAAQVKGLSALAKELNLVAVILAQLNRKSVSERRRPRLDDFRESGSIDHAADLALLLHLEDFAAEPGQPVPQNLLHVIVAKQRNGERGDVQLVTRFDQMRLENAAREIPIYRTPFDVAM